MMHGDGGDLTMAQVCGEQPYGSLVFYPGEHFDPSDPEEVEHVRMASENDAAQTIAQLREENDRLRAELAPVGEDGEPLPCVECGTRPWGFGYCGELCRECAAKPDAHPAT